VGLNFDSARGGCSLVRGRRLEGDSGAAASLCFTTPPPPQLLHLSPSTELDLLFNRRGRVRDVPLGEHFGVAASFLVEVHAASVSRERAVNGTGEGSTGLRVREEGAFEGGTRGGESETGREKGEEKEKRTEEEHGRFSLGEGCLYGQGVCWREEEGRFKKSEQEVREKQEDTIDVDVEA
jgi:hypothetical protein